MTRIPGSAPTERGAPTVVALAVQVSVPRAAGTGTQLWPADLCVRDGTPALICPLLPRRLDAARPVPPPVAAVPAAPVPRSLDDLDDAMI